MDNLVIVSYSQLNNYKEHFKRMFKDYYKEKGCFSVSDPNPKELNSAVENYWKYVMDVCIIKNSVGILLFAKYGQKIVAMLYWVPLYTPWETKNKVLTGGIFVSKSYRLKGIATELRKKAAWIATKRKFTHVSGTVSEGNEDGEALTKMMAKTGTVYQCRISQLL